ncbi:MAG: hypothetical protein AB7I27_11495 [Bacteriovoracaceae bacterium]
MTSSFKSFQKHPKILIIHGMNNNLSCFIPLQEEFLRLGFECELIPLPGHDEKHRPVKNLQIALEIFGQEIKNKIDGPYFIISFSQGSLYTQVWLERNLFPKPKAQVLLAPALSLKYPNLAKNLVRILPNDFKIKGQTPVELRLKSKLSILDYQILLDGIFEFKNNKSPFPIPSLLMIDPKDELLNAKEMLEFKYSHLKTISIKRPKLNKWFGSHHVLFHPDYFEADEWIRFISEINNFFQEHSGSFN